MGTKVITIMKQFILSILIFSFFSIVSLNAQEKQSEKYTPKDLFGLYASIAPMGMGTLLSPPLGANMDQFSFSQIGGRVQLGWLLHKKSLTLPTLVAAYSFAINNNSASSGQFNSISLFDLGAEIIPWTLYVSKQQKHIVAIKLGTYFSMCTTQFGSEKTKQHHFGVSRKVSLGYIYKMDSGLCLGVNLYNHAGHYFGKRPQSGFPIPLYTEELGIAFDFYL